MQRLFCKWYNYKETVNAVSLGGKIDEQELFNRFSDIESEC